MVNTSFQKSHFQIWFKVTTGLNFDILRSFGGDFHYYLSASGTTWDDLIGSSAIAVSNLSFSFIGICNSFT